LLKWSSVEGLNSVRDLSQFMKEANGVHIAAMYHAKKYHVGTAEQGFLLKLNCVWDGNQNFDFVIYGVFDSDFAKEPLTHKKCEWICYIPVWCASYYEYHACLSGLFFCETWAIYVKHILHETTNQVKRVRIKMMLFYLRCLPSKIDVTELLQKGNQYLEIGMHGVLKPSLKKSVYKSESDSLSQKT